MLSMVTAVDKEVILMGDINVDYLIQSEDKEIKSIFDIYGYKQLIKGATHITKETKTCIDVIQTNNPQVISATKVIPVSFSDHDMIGCVRKLNHLKYNPKTIKCRNYKNYDPSKFSESIANHPDYEHVLNGTDPNVCWEKLKAIIVNSLNNFCPNITKRVKGKPCPWLSVQLRAHMNERDQLLRKSRKTNSTADVQAYKRKRNLVNYLVRQSKKAYYKDLLRESANNTNSFWKALKQLFPTKKSTNSTTFKINGEVTCCKYKIANAFCKYFSHVVKGLKNKAFILKNCVWKEQISEPIRTCRRFKFQLVSVKEVEFEI